MSFYGPGVFFQVGIVSLAWVLFPVGLRWGGDGMVFPARLRLLARVIGCVGVLPPRVGRGVCWLYSNLDALSACELSSPLAAGYCHGCAPFDGVSFVRNRGAFPAGICLFSIII